MTALLDSPQSFVTVGIDAHKETHHAVILDGYGVRLSDKKFPANSAGYSHLLIWAAGFGHIDRIGIESTGSYAAGLTRHLIDAHIDVLEVNCPHPQTKARKGKDDAIDAKGRRPESSCRRSHSIAQGHYRCR